MAEGQTATNPQTGEKVIFRGGQWVPFGAQPDRYVAPIEGPPSQKTTLQNEKTAAEIQDIPMNRAVTQATLQDRETTARFKPAEQALKLADNYRQEQAVKDYRAAIGNYGSLLNTAPNPQGDLSLIYSFARIMDPGSVVRDGEMDLAKSTSPVVQQVYQRFQKELAGGGALSDESRRQLRMEAANKMGALNNAYLAARVNYKQFADRYGLNPMDVVGAHEGIRFQDAEARLLGRPITKLDYNGNPVKPDSPIGGQPRNPNDPAGAHPNGIEFNMDSAPQDGNQFTPEQAKQIMGFVSRNPDPTALMGYLDAISGGKMNVTPETAAEMVKAIKQGNWGGFTYDAQKEQRARAEAEAAKINKVDGAPGLGTLGTQGITLGLSDEAAGLGKAIAGMFQGGDGSFADNYTLGRDAERIRIEQARQNTGALGTAAEIGSGLLSGGASVLTGPVKAAAVGGGIAGFGYGEGAVNSTTNALLGAGGGAVLAKGMGVVGNRLASRALRNSLLPDVAQAAQAEGVRVGRPIVDPSVRAKMGALESTPGGSNVVRDGLQQTSSDVEAAVGRLGRNGQALDNVVAGEKVQDAGRRTMQQTKTVVDRLYKRAEGMSAGVKADPKNAVAILDQNLAELGQAPETNAAVIRFLEGLKSDLSNGPLSIDTIRQIRSGIRGSISEKNLSFSDAERRAMQVLDAASQDIEAALGSNPQALQAYKLADTRYRQRREYIDQVLSPILGKRDNPLSGEKAFAKIQAMASPKGNSRQMASLWKSLTPDEASDVAATMAANLGRDAAGEFSPARFVSQVARLSPQARRVAFGPDGTRSIENLVKISDAYSAASKDINWSRSGAVRNYRELLRDVVLGGGGGGALSMMSGGSGATTAIMAAGAAGAAAGGKAIANNLSAKTLMNPQFAKWLANAPNTTSARAIDQHFSQLAKIAASNPAMATEVNGLRQMLIEAVSKSPGRATASEDKQN